MQQWNVVVELGFVKVAGNRNQVVLLHEIAGRRGRAAERRVIGNVRRVELDFTVRLFEKDENVAMQAGVLRWTRSDVLEDRFAGAQIAAFDVHGQPMSEFSSRRFFARWGVGV